MPSANSNVTPIRLASDQQSWREMDQLIHDCVTRILGNIDEATTRDFMFLVDILTNENIALCDRWSAIRTVQTLAFCHSPRFIEDMENYLNEINPGRVIKRSRKQVSA